MTPREELLAEWYKLRQEIDANTEMMKPKCEREMELRKFLLQDIWGSQLREGVNNWEAGGGFLLKGTYKLNRKVIKEAVSSVRERLLENRINPDRIFRWDPFLETKEYRGLNEELQKIVDSALVITPAAPTLELIPPKEK